MPSLTGFGAESTRSFASFRPRPVIARTTLITWIFWPPAAVRTTSKDVFSSAAAPSPAAGAPGAATATGAAAVIPHSSSIFFFSSTRSRTDIFPSSSNTLSVALAAITAPPVPVPFPFPFPFPFHEIQLVALSHFLLQQPVPPLPERVHRPPPRLVALSHLPPLRTCRPARGAVRCGHRVARTGPGAVR